MSRELEALFTATTSRLPRPSQIVFKMLLLQQCYGLSDPQCEKLVGDRLSSRRFVGLDLDEPLPDETTLVRFRQRLLGLVNQQLEERGLILKRVTLVDAPLLQAALRAPGEGSPAKGDPEADHTVKNRQPRYGRKAHVAADEAHTLDCQAALSAAGDHDSRRFEEEVEGDEQMVVADKAYCSRERSTWPEERNIQNGILRRRARNHPLGRLAPKLNRFLSGLRSGIEKMFGQGKRSLGCRRGRPLRILRNRPELELKCVVWNLRRRLNRALAAWIAPGPPVGMELCGSQRRLQPDGWPPRRRSNPAFPFPAATPTSFGPVVSKSRRCSEVSSRNISHHLLVACGPAPKASPMRVVPDFAALRHTESLDALSRSTSTEPRSSKAGTRINDRIVFWRRPLGPYSEQPATWSRS